MNGSNLPPGVTASMIPGNQEFPCDVCGRFPDKCECPECPECGENGNPVCYQQHGMKRTKTQLIGKSKLEISKLENMISDHAQYIQWLEGQPDEYTES